MVNSPCTASPLQQIHLTDNCQDYTTDTYLIQKWTDPRLASEAWKVEKDHDALLVISLSLSAGAAGPGGPQAGPGHLEAGGFLPECQGGRLPVRDYAQPPDQDPPRWRNSLYSETEAEVLLHDGAE